MPPGLKASIVPVATVKHWTNFAMSQGRTWTRGISACFRRSTTIVGTRSTGWVTTMSRSVAFALRSPVIVRCRSAAISAYEEALVLDPSDADARWNLELALRKLADVDAKAGAGRRRGANWGGGNLTKSGYAGAPQTGAGAAPGGGFGGSQGEQPAQQITETRARALLNALERAQVSGQAAHPGNTSSSVSRGQDW